ncbi:MAG: hypothetical protein IPM69_05330 [Ignavibacteria bacterium]|nr:hypothetical protein [Ignavibacteria bacterium]
MGSFEELLAALRTKDVPNAVVQSINAEIHTANSFSGTSKEHRKKFRKLQLNVLKILEKELKLVIKNHYRNMWLVLGMSAFGIPIGVAFGVSIGNMGFLGVGMPIGMAIGIAVGIGMDNKAMLEGRQLNVELKY